MTLICSKPQITVNGIPMPGSEYREMCLRNICMLKWPNAILTVITGMFREMPLLKDETITIVKKLCDSLLTMSPQELPALAYQLFSLCSMASTIVIPLFSFNLYFHRHFYKKLFIEMGSDPSNMDSNGKWVRFDRESPVIHVSPFRSILR